MVFFSLRRFNYMIDPALLQRYIKPVVYLLIAGGFALSQASLLGVCFDACSEAHAYRFYGMDFGWLGIALFTLLAALRSGYSMRFNQLAFAVIIASAFGAEVWFLIVQKSIIRSWCPLCVSIAAIVFLIVCFAAFENYLLEEVPVKFVNRLKRFAIPIASALFGLAVAFFGVAKPDAGAETLDIWLGKSDSPVEVYVITDWFCPSCRKSEPEIEAGVKSVLKQARIAFVDFAIHSETRNFSPYNLSFQIHEKAKYLQLRSTLHNLALKTKTPSIEAVQAAVAPLDVRFRQMPLNDIMAGLDQYKTMIATVGATATPTVVIRNAKTGKLVRKMEGYDKIKSAEIRAAVQEAMK